MSAYNSISGAIKRQYDATLAMLRHGIDDMPDEKWAWEKGEWCYSLTLYHILETMEFYLASDPKEMEWGKRAGFSWDDLPDKRGDVLPLITKELTFKYLIEIQHSLDSLFETLSDKDILKRDGFDWFSSVFEKLTYLLRHNQHHLGELSLGSRMNTGKSIKWT
jgi:hypothetical protein